MGLFEKLGWITISLFLILIFIYMIAICLFQLDSDQISTLTNLFVASATFLTSCTALLLYSNWKGKEIYDIELDILATIDDATNYFLYEFNTTTLSIKKNVSEILKTLNLDNENQLSLETIVELDYWIFKHNKKLHKFTSSFQQQLLLVKKLKSKNKFHEIKLPITEINGLSILCVDLKKELIDAIHCNQLKDFFVNLDDNHIWKKLDTSNSTIYSIVTILSDARSQILASELDE